MKRSASQNKQVSLLQMAFRARKVLRTFEKRAPVNRSEDIGRILYIYSQAWVNIWINLFILVKLYKSLDNLETLIWLTRDLTANISK